MHKVLFVASEAHPLAKTGGLGDVAGSLPGALRALGNDVRLLLPAYPGAKRALRSLRAIAQINVAFAQTPATLLEGTLPGSDVILWLVDHPPAFDREGHPYVDASGRPWPDNAQRFGLLCAVAAALSGMQTEINWRPDVVHCHDWQTGLVPALLATRDSRPATVFTIHNLAYQGLFPAETFATLALAPTLWSMHALEFYGQLSFIKGGLVYADRLTTVSPTYAREIQTPEFGYGLEDLLRQRADRLSGILNGIDTDVWNPAADPHLVQPYSARSLDRKAVNKRALQEQLGLSRETRTPLIGMIGRFVEQKGFDLALSVWPELAEQRVQLALLGSGESGLVEAWRRMERRYPDQVAVRIGYDEALPHRIEAAADMFLMPSRFEPCGLNQMYSLRYGTVPIVRRVGGLADTVVDASPQALADNSATGVVFDEATPGAVAQAMRRALALYHDEKVWRALALNGMRQDFSWRQSAREYAALYDRIAPTRA
jgi:starch synthase